ncbi:MAG: hypothetical protein JRN62_03135 [Nitrososphaerota archaeon]|jgi:hypothetical protein|nr:hypothetical protein [Nitrososphaerota archaeon]MDG6948591.1 hypothetical protein [Nitrososphaerota archaeon]
MKDELDESPPPGAKQTSPHHYEVLVKNELVEVEDLGPDTIPRYAAMDESGRTFFHNQLKFIITPPTPGEKSRKHHTVNDSSTLLQLLAPDSTPAV